jgi:hypothetical protein
MVIGIDPREVVGNPDHVRIDFRHLNELIKVLFVKFEVAYQRCVGRMGIVENGAAGTQ